MKKKNIENLSVLAKGLIISVTPFVVIYLETFFVKSYSMGFLVSALSKIGLVGIIGLILSGTYILSKKRYSKLSKNLVKGIIIFYYLLSLIYFGIVIYFQLQAPLFS